MGSGINALRPRDEFHGSSIYGASRNATKNIGQAGDLTREGYTRNGKCKRKRAPARRRVPSPVKDREHRYSTVLHLRAKPNITPGHWGRLREGAESRAEPRTRFPQFLNSPLGPTYRQRVTRWMPSSRQRADTDVSRSTMAAWASRTWALVRANFRPPLRPVRGQRKGLHAAAKFSADLHREWIRPSQDGSPDTRIRACT